MAAPAGTLAYRTYVTLSAAGNTNGDATAIAAAFNGIIFSTVSNTAATATASAAVVTIYWPESGIRLARELVRDFVAAECVALAPTLNAAVTNIQCFTEINMS